MPPAESIIDVLVGEIDRSGPIGFDRFMEVALYHPAFGYFSSDVLRSDRAGDFLTSPEVSDLFGEVLARFVDEERRRVGEPFEVTEIGGGSGSLLRPLLDGLESPPTAVSVVERSRAAQLALAEEVPEAGLVAEVSTRRGVVIGNEVLDNFPAAIAVRHGRDWVEEGVTHVDGVLTRAITAPRPEIEQWVGRFAGSVPDGGRVEVQVEATRWVTRIVTALESGAVLLFDYGGDSHALESRRAEGTIRTYQGHHLGPDPLVSPGATDITMDVDFGAMSSAAAAGGADVEVLRQDEFLEALGLRDRIAELRAEELEAARDGRTMDRLLLKSRITGAETLLHPRGLGDFRVLIARK